MEQWGVNGSCLRLGGWGWGSGREPGRNCLEYGKYVKTCPEIKNKSLKHYEIEAKVITSVERQESEEAGRAEYGEMNAWIDVTVVMVELKVRYVVQQPSVSK